MLHHQVLLLDVSFKIDDCNNITMAFIYKC